MLKGKLRIFVLGIVVLLSSFLVVSSLSAQGKVSFTRSAAFVSGSRPIYIAVADFDGDGNMDLAVANEGEGANSVAIRLGNGDGTFRDMPTVLVGRNPRSIAVGDFNGDGKPDLVVANAGGTVVSMTVSVLLGNGDGTFQRASSFNVGKTPFSVAVGDFNNDGIDDFVVAMINFPDPGLVSCWLNNGDGTFRLGQTVEVGPARSTPSSVVVADFNRDGNMDFAVSNSGSGNTFIGLGMGDGTFRRAHVFDVNGSAPISLAVGDFDGDGKPDLAIANLESNNVTVWLGNGDGYFHWVQNADVGASPLSIATADFDGDGTPDLAVANFGYFDNRSGSAPGTNVSILLGQTSGQFAPSQSMEIGAKLSAVAVGDFNGDGKPDLAVADWVSNTVIVLLNTSP